MFTGAYCKHVSAKQHDRRDERQRNVEVGKNGITAGDERRREKSRRDKYEKFSPGLLHNTSWTHEAGSQMQSLKCDYAAVLCYFSLTAGKFTYEKCQLNLSETLATVAYSVSVVWRLQQCCLNLVTFNYWTTSSVKYIYQGCQMEVNTTVHCWQLLFTLIWQCVEQRKIRRRRRSSKQIYFQTCYLNRWMEPERL